ncbi:Aspartate aminotransferase [Vanrija pseudolonga]|uniref:Aspartate aminotransferase n=1 Tax=Vanrija pseudolonga TaxID=143232 RepID=A0AAF1BHC5_9TREE|nr:Aspartate aminotransferase [Vanrija pseudolonga]
MATRFYEVAAGQHTPQHKPNARHERDSEAHKILRQYAGNQHAQNKNEQQGEESLPGVRAPGATGVIYCTDRAIANGFSYENQEWANLGQGAPEVNALPGDPPRPTVLDFTKYGDFVHEYAPTVGVKELRQAVANLYNHQYRQGRTSQYTYENVCIVPGGRAGMSRVAAVIGDVYCGYQIPEYTTYSEVLSVFKRLVPIPSHLPAEDKYKLDINKLKSDIKNMSLSVVVMSNPRNPTGQVIQGQDLKDVVDLGKTGTTIILDEFYSWYMYWDDKEKIGKSISGAEYVDDVNADSVILIDGMTKGPRLPGWRVCWVVGPKSLISAVSQSGSFLDGGANHPLQMAAIPQLEPSRVLQSKIALQNHFKAKRDYVLQRLDDMGLPVHCPPQATFYIWLDLSGLAAPLDSALVFFEELLREKTIVVPGLWFDINPSHRRNLFDSPCHHFVRISFGPPLETLKRGLDSIERLLDKHRRASHHIGHSYRGSVSYDFPGVNHNTHI